MGKNFRDATALEVIDQNEAVIHLIYPLTDYIIGDGRIEIPNGLIGYASEGINRRIRVWNTLGQGEPSEEQFSIITGPPVVTATSYDGLPFDRDEPLVITGVGFKSSQVNLGNAAVNYTDGNSSITHVSLETEDGDPLDGNASGLGLDLRSQLTVLSDTRAILSGGSLGAWADGSSRIIRVGRGTTTTMSERRENEFQLISVKPEIDSLAWVELASEVRTDINASSALPRDEAIWIIGNGLKAATKVELVRETGASYEPPSRPILSMEIWMTMAPGCALQNMLSTPPTPMGLGPPNPNLK